MVFLLAHRVYDPETDLLKKVPAGIYTNRQQLYKAIAVDERVTASDADPREAAVLEFPSLLLRMKTGERTLKYQRLNGMLRELGRVAIYDLAGKCIYVIWAIEPNAMPELAELETEVEA